MNFKNTKQELKVLGCYFFLLWMFTILVFMGTSFNFYAVMDNGGRMPVQATYGSDTDTHFYFTEPHEVERYYLTDIIFIPSKKYGSMISIGDILIFTGIILMVGVLINLCWSIWGSKPGT